MLAQLIEVSLNMCFLTFTNLLTNSKQTPRNKIYFTKGYFWRYLIVTLGGGDKHYEGLLRQLLAVDLITEDKIFIFYIKKKCHTLVVAVFFFF